MGMTLILTSAQYRCTPASFNRLMASSSFQSSQINPSLDYPSIYPFLPQPPRLLPTPHTVVRLGVIEANFHAWLSHRIALCLGVQERVFAYVCESEWDISQQPYTSPVVADPLTYLHWSALAPHQRAFCVTVKSGRLSRPTRMYRMPTQTHRLSDLEKPHPK